MAERSFFCLHLFRNCASNQSTFKHPFDIRDGLEDLGVSSHRQSEAPLSPNDVNCWKRVQAAVASRLNCSFNETARKAVLLLQDLMREPPTCCSRLTSSRVAVMMIRNHLGARWFGVVPNQTNRSTPVPGDVCGDAGCSSEAWREESLWWSGQNINCTGFHNICTHMFACTCAPLMFFSVFLWSERPPFKQTHVCTRGAFVR